MDPSTTRAPGGALTPFQKDLRRLATELVVEHRNCDVGNLQKCDLYHDLIEIMENVALDVREAERALMICGHPAACSPDGRPCIACQRETRLVGRVGGLS